MRKVYLIVVEQRMPQFGVIPQSLGIVEFAFTSKAKANEQMNVIHRMIESGEWYSSGSYIIEYDSVDDSLAFKRTIKINHSNGTYTFYTLQEVVLNSGYGV